MALLDRAKAILLTPKTEWPVIEAESATTGSLFTGYAIPLAAIPAVAGFIGWSVVGISVLGTSIKLPMSDALVGALVRFVGGLIGVFVLGLIIDALAPSFGGQKNPIQALKVAVYSSTASWVAGIFLIIPSLGILSVLGLYSLYLLYLGLPQLMKAPADKAVGYTAVVVVVGVVLFLIVGAVTNQLVGYGSWVP
jgi:Yip1-like protein